MTRDEPQRASCTVSPAGCLIWLGMALLGLWAATALWLWVTER
jgi:hypothetical protein